MNQLIYIYNNEQIFFRRISLTLRTLFGNFVLITSLLTPLPKSLLCLSHAINNKYDPGEQFGNYHQKRVGVNYHYLVVMENE